MRSTPGRFDPGRAAGWRGWLGWPAVAAVTIGIGLAAAVSLHPWLLQLLDWRRVLEAGQSWSGGGDPYLVSGYFYTPALAMLASVLPDWSAYIILVAEIVVVLLVVPRHPLAIAAAFAYPPVWGDLALGNVTILLVGAFLLAIRTDSRAGGIPFGIGLALVPKPMFLPVLLWMVVHRRRSLTGTMLSGLAVTGAALAGSADYAAFIAALSQGIPPHFDGNIGITTVLPDAGIMTSIGALVVTVLLVRGETTGLMAAAIAGTFMGTYVGLYAPVLPAAVLPAYHVAHPRRALAIGWIGSVAWLALPIAAVGGWLVELVRWRPRGRGMRAAAGPGVVAPPLPDDTLRGW